MSAKLVPPPLVPSAEKRAVRILIGMTAIRHGEEHVPMIRAIERAADDGFHAGIDAVIALLREPDAQLVSAGLAIKREGIVNLRMALRLIAEELELRKP